MFNTVFGCVYRYVYYSQLLPVLQKGGETFGHVIPKTENGIFFFSTGTYNLPKFQLRIWSQKLKV